MNEDVKEYAEQINGSKMRKSNDLENGQEPEKGKNFEEKCKKSFYQHRSNFNERNDANCNSSVLNIEHNNLNRPSSCDSGSTKNGNCRSTYRNTYNTSSSEDEDEYCVYTYKGAEVASNLPESFFNLGVDAHNGREGSVCSSPEMDFLEMDFDPTSNGQDSDSDNVSPVPENIPNVFIEFQEPVACDENANCCEKAINVEVREEPVKPQLNELASSDFQQPCCSRSLPLHESPIDNGFKDNRLAQFQEYSSDSSDDESPKSASMNSSFDYFKIFDGNWDIHAIVSIADGYRDDNQSPCRTDYSACISDTNDIKEHFNCFDGLLPMDPTYSISTVVNVLTALHIPHDSLSVNCKLSELLHRRRIHKNTSLIDYLSLRSIEPVSEVELSHFLTLSTDFGIHSRFFYTYPKRNINLLEWLSNWIKKGAVPVVTRNLQKRGRMPVKNIMHHPWRHNVVYRVELSNIHLTNPIEKVPESTLQRQLCQPPLTYIKKSSLMKRWNPQLDLRPLSRPKDQRWYKENVLGQLAVIIREQNAGFKTNHHIRIPSNCRCGITIFVPNDNKKLCKEVDEAAELPLA